MGERKGGFDREMVEEEFQEVHGSYSSETFTRMLNVAR